VPEKIKGDILFSFFLLFLSLYNLMDIETCDMGGSNLGGREDMLLRRNGGD